MIFPSHDVSIITFYILNTFGEYIICNKIFSITFYNTSINIGLFIIFVPSLKHIIDGHFLY